MTDQKTLVNYLATIKPKTFKHYKHYVPIKIGDVTCQAMVDSGNLFKNVISKGFMMALGLTMADLEPMEGRQTVGTAKEGGKLHILGRVRNPLHM